MSCFESSTFRRNKGVANAQYMAEACQKLGLKHEPQGRNITRIFDENDQLLMVVDYGRVFYNQEKDLSLIASLEKEAADYVAHNQEAIDAENKIAEEQYQQFLEMILQRERDRAALLAEKAQHKKVINRLDIEYARLAIIRTFESRGFYYQPDNNFVANNEVAARFYMCAYTVLDEAPEDRITAIQFDVLQNGSIVSDSNYIPEDVHEKADEAMEALEKAMGCTRREGIEIKRKRIPEGYKSKAYCSIHQKNMAGAAMA